ncbi:hypothetical protein JYU20_00535 [Bacteroidales bacterium AH-315-I05]|nr:hypothetical protein [Bacteroidales bacterium AH-315-I05]
MQIRIGWVALFVIIAILIGFGLGFAFEVSPKGIEAGIKLKKGTNGNNDTVEE